MCKTHHGIYYIFIFVLLVNLCLLVRYKEMPEEDALRDLSKRAAAAKLAYKSVNSAAYCWARLYDMGSVAISD